MSRSPIASSGRLLGNAAVPRQSQHQAAGYSQGRPLVMQQEDGDIQEQRHCALRKAQVAQEAAKMAEEAASLAGQAADMARRAAQLAARASSLLSDRPPMPPTQEAFDIFPREEPSSFAPVPPQPPRQTNQPIESYQSEFPALEKSRRKRKSKTPAQDASGSGTVSAIVPSVIDQRGETPVWALADYQLQLMLLKQQKEKGLRMSQRQESKECTSAPDMPLVNLRTEIERPGLS